jgi:hypothetical protein
MKNTIKVDAYTFKARWGNKFITPRSYKDDYYTAKRIPEIINEIESEFPRYKGKVVPFQMVLVPIW